MEIRLVWKNTNPEPYYSHIKDKYFVSSGVCHNGKWHWWSAVCEDYLLEYGRCDFDEMDDAIEVTHWMPLPEPPEVKE